MSKKLSFDNDLSFSDDYDDEEVNHAIKDISSVLSFNSKDNPLLEDFTASHKLLATFRKRRAEIEKLLENHNLGKQEKSELKLELKMIKQALDQNSA